MSWINPRLRPGERRKVITGFQERPVWCTCSTGRRGNSSGRRHRIPEHRPRHRRCHRQAEANPEVVFERVGQEVRSCPGWIGGKDWEAVRQPAHQHDALSAAQRLRDGASHREGRGAAPLPPRGENRKDAGQRGDWHRARDLGRDGQDGLVARAARGTTSLMTTGGGLVFGGDVNGRFHAFDQKSGQVLGNQPRPASDRVPDFVRGRRQTVRGRQSPGMPEPRRAFSA